jgi:hypothetical protein
MCKQNKKKHEVACERIEPQFFTLQNYAQYSASCLQKAKQHPKKQQTTPTPQNRSPRNQKSLATC